MALVSYLGVAGDRALAVVREEALDECFPYKIIVVGLQFFFQLALKSNIRGHRLE